jgi:hypothetical protein
VFIGIYQKLGRDDTSGAHEIMVQINSKYIITTYNLKYQVGKHYVKELHVTIEIDFVVHPIQCLYVKVMPLEIHMD